ncbi:MAG: YhdP family protein [Burkholderiaceae bacterium]
MKPPVSSTAPAAPSTSPNPSLGNKQAGAGVPARPGKRRRLARLGLFFTGGLILVIGLSYLGVRHLLMPNLDRWEPEIEQLLSQQVGLPVKLAGLAGEFEGFNPAIRWQSLEIGEDPNNPRLIAGPTQAVLSWRTILSGRPNFAFLRSTDVALRVERLTEKRLLVAGIPFDLPETRQSELPVGVNEPWLLPDWLMRQQSVQLNSISLDYFDRQTRQRAVLRKMSFASEGSATQRKIRLSIPRTDGLVDAAKFEATLSRPRLTGAKPGQRWQGDAYAEAAGVDVPAVTKILRLPEALVAGVASAQAWFSVVNSKPNDARLLIEGRQWQTNPRQPDERFVSVQAEVDVGWRTNGNVDLTILDASAIDQTGSEIALSNKTQVLTVRPDLLPVRARFSLRQFDAERLIVMARTLPLTDSLTKALENLRLSGTVDQIEVDFDARSGRPRYKVNADFQALDVAFGPERWRAKPLLEFDPRPPWFEQLSGTIRMTEKGGEIGVKSPEAAIGLPGIYAEPRLAVRNLDADVAWTISPVAGETNRSARAPVSAAQTRAGQAADLSGLSVNIKKLRMENDDATADISGVWSGAGKSRRGTIDLKARLTRASIKRTYRYVPTDLPQDVREWMETSILGGQSDDVRFVLRGDLLDFPFRRPSEGQLLISADIRDGTLKYLDEFPAITSVDALLKVEGAGLDVDVSKGRVFKRSNLTMQVKIPEFKTAELAVDVKVDGPAQEAVRFVNATPLSELIDHFLKDARISSRARTVLDIDVPLNNVEEGIVFGETRLKNASGRLTSYLPQMNEGTGTIRYGTSGFSTDDLTVRMLGGKASVRAVTPREGQLDLNVRGQVTDEGLRSEVDTPITRRLRGKTTYDAAISAADNGVRLNVKSQLEGMAINLPEPLRKAAAQTIPLTITSRPVRLAGRNPPRWGDRLAVRLGEDMQAIFERDPNAKGQLRVKRGVITVDSVPTMPDEGLALAVSTRSLNMDRWLEALELVGESETSAGATNSESGANDADSDNSYFAGFELEPSKASVIADALIYSEKTFTDVVLGSSREAQVWSANIAADQVNGYINWVSGGGAPGQQQLIGKFQRLEIPDTRTTEFDGLLNTPTTSLPALDIEAENFILSGRALGRLKLVASNRFQGWEISRLSLENAASLLAGSGLWRRDSDGAQRSNLRFDLDLIDAGGLLGLLGQPDTVRGGAGKLSGQINWRGAPAAFDIPTLNGELTLALGPGQFLRTEPGLAKLIGVLSLQSIPRRLSLDFSDIFAAGFAFDTIVGQAQIKDGNLSTENLLMNGVQAQVLIGGQANLLAETQDMTVEVLPTINAGLASLAYAALANPAVGIGTLLAQLVLQDPLRQLFRYEFEIDGPWADPVVTQTRPIDPSPDLDTIHGPND